MRKTNNGLKALGRAKKFLIILMSAIIAVALCVTCALFVAPARQAPVENVEEAGVGVSATPTTYLNQTGSGNKVGIKGNFLPSTSRALKNGDILEFTYTGTKGNEYIHYDIKLPKGDYKLEAWGAQGGSNAAYSTTGIGGKGGYSVGLYSVTAAAGQVLWITPGGCPGNSTIAGSNGGGASTGEGRGGGGASMIATGQRTVGGTCQHLYHYTKAADMAKVIMVAGGGGGAQRYAGGAGGGLTAGSATQGVGTPGKGGVTLSGTSGTGGAGGKPGTFGQGGAGTAGKDKKGGGGGGGGWYGGGGAKSDDATGTVDDYGGGGGSGYIKTDVIKTGNVSGMTFYNSNGSVSNSVYVMAKTEQQSTRTGHGYIKITVLKVNADPVANATTPTFSGGTRGINKTITIAPSDLATDPEGSTLYFTNRTATNLDLVPSANAGIFIDSSGVTSASSYIKWSITQSSITISQIIKYPRSTAATGWVNGKFKLWVAVRDTYYDASSTFNTHRGYKLVPFYLTVTETAPVHRGLSSSGSSAPTSFSGGSSTIYIGNSNKTTLPVTPSTSQIYHPSRSGQYTAMVANTLRIYNPENTADENNRSQVTIRATDLFTGISTYDMPIISINSSAIASIQKSNTGRIFKVNEYDNGANAVTAYDINGGRIQNAFTQLTIVGTNSNPNYQVLPVTVYVVEKSAAKGSNYQLTYVPAKELHIVVRVNNERPVLKSGVSNVVNLTTTGSAATVKLSSYYNDPDNAITDKTHTILGVSVPKQEFLQVTKSGSVVTPPINGSSYYYNAIKSSSGPTSAEITNAVNNGTSGVSTGFEDWYITPSSSNEAFVRYSYSNDSITLTGLRATYSLYDAARTTTSYYAATATGAQQGKIINAGAFYILLHIRDKNDPADNGIYLPLAINVSNTAPTAIRSERGQNVVGAMPTASGGKDDVFYFTPMGITVPQSGTNVTYPIGSYMKDGALTNAGLRPLASDYDNFYVSNAQNRHGKLNELIIGYSTASAVQSSIPYNSGGQYFTVEELPIYIPVSSLGESPSAASTKRARVNVSSYGTQTEIPAGSGTKYIQVRGYKVTLKSWTHNRFLYASVQVRDSQNSSVTVYIAINCTNSTPTALTNATGQKVATLDYESSGTRVKSEYDSTNKTITYSIPVGKTAFITPYDILTDYNMTNSGVAYPTDGFTLNGLSGSYSKDDLKFTVGSSSVGRAITGIATNANTVDYSTSAYQSALKTTLNKLTDSTSARSFTSCIYANNTNWSPGSLTTSGIDRLFFARTTDSSNLDGAVFNPYATTAQANSFATPVIQNGGYVNYEFGNRLVFANDSNKEYRIDFIAITAKSRSDDNYTTFKLTVRDRMGAGASGNASGTTTITVRVRVINSTPSLANPDTVYTMSTDPKAGVTTYNLSALGLLRDNESDPVYYNVHEYFAGFSAPIKVVDGTGSATDVGGNDYRDNYIGVSISESMLTVTALNSTQNITSGLYLWFFATDGRSNAEYSTLKIQIIVKNAPLTVNYDADSGFDLQDVENANVKNLWTINSKNASDISMMRYFASSNAASQSLIKGGYDGRSVFDSQVKTLFTDTDGLQGAVLAPITSIAPNPSGFTYKNAPTSGSADYKKYVPYLVTPNSDAGITDLTSTSDSNINTAAVVLDWSVWSGANLATQSTKPITTADEYIDLSKCDIVYFVDANGDGVKEPYYASKLRASSDTTVNNYHAKFFDSQGRWTVSDWAIAVTPKQKAFPANTFLRLRVMSRDDALYGGDTAGKSTAYKNEVVSGYKLLSYNLYIKPTGIVTLDYYNQFNGWYTVADGASTAGYAGKNYISTTSGGGKGANSGAVYSSTLAETDNAFKGAFKYTHTIDVDADKSNPTYIPMSYFALRNDLVTAATDGSVVYSKKEFVGYDITSGKYSRNDLSAVSKAITVSDGITTYSGASLNSNPYITVSVFDAYYSGAVHADNTGYATALAGPYYNDRLAVPTYKSDGTATDFIGNSQNAANFAATGNRIMYLAGQATNLQEHMFGIGIAKNEKRVSAARLTITIAVALCEMDDDDKTNINYQAADKSSKTAKVTFNVNVGNSTMSLITDTSGNNGNIVKVDKTDGQYYVDAELVNGGSSFEIDLKRKQPSETNNGKTVWFNDGDADDSAYFYSDSTKKLGSWSGGADSYDLPKTLANEEAAVSAIAVFANTDPSSAAQNSIAGYYGQKVVGNSSAGIKGISEAYQPNGGIYGTNNGTNGGGDEGYSSYFSANVAENGSRLVITPRAKTIINTESKDYPSGQENIRQHYATRGLVVQFESASSSKVVSAYYPFKIMIYDSCGDGWSNGSFVALEVRVYIANAKPAFLSNLDNTVGGAAGDKTIDVSLSVGSSYSLNLINLLGDSDLLKSDKGWYWKDDYVALRDKQNPTAAEVFDAESGDYLVSPFDKWAATGNDKLRDGKAGFNDHGLPIADQPDVIMWMEYNAKNSGETLSTASNAAENIVPANNIIRFSVNRRTTYVEGTGSNAISKTQSRFEFKLTFTDSVGTKTGVLTVVINVLNQLPTVIAPPVTRIKMRVNDSFTILTTPYDRFNDGSASSVNSNTLRMYGSSRGNKNGSLVYSALTADNLRTDTYKLRDYTPTEENAQHLGYTAIATDDTPWSLRIKDVEFGSACFTKNLMDTLPYEQTPKSNSYLGLNAVITATKVCSETTVTVTVDDGDGGSVSYTIFVTVESSKPKPITAVENGVTHFLNTGLVLTDTAGVYDLYMTVDSESVGATGTSVTLDTGKTVTAFGSLDVKIQNVAYDPDFGDNANIGLFNDTGNIFKLNTAKMDVSSGNQQIAAVYSSDRYRIDIAAGKMQSFKITCLGYDYYSEDDCDELEFYVKDAGNDVRTNAVRIVIRIHTLYSSMTNKHATDNAPRGVVASADTVYVKPYDVFVGNGVKPESSEYASIGVQSRYQFLKYGNMPSSIDQTAESGAYIIDPDVSLTPTGGIMPYNLHYDVRVYAFVDGSGTELVSKRLSDLSNLFAIDNAAGTIRLSDSDKVSQYLVGGITSTGASYDDVNSVLLSSIRNYFEFGIGEDGVSITFSPQTSNYNVPILFYVEAQKLTSNRVRPQNAATAAGSLFYVRVKDSAPLANAAKETMSFKGKVGDTKVFSIFDMDEPFASMFTDSDDGDSVRVNPVDYDKALSGVSYDWRGGSGKQRAVDILVNNADEEADIVAPSDKKTYTLPKRSLMVIINRRIDAKNKNGDYLPEVEIPVVISGVDRENEASDVTLYVTIVNSDLTIKEAALTDGEFNAAGVGYSLRAGDDDDSFELNTYVSKDTDPLKLDVIKWLDDPDFTGIPADTESFRLVKDNEDADASKYLFSGALDVFAVVDGVATTEKVAKLTPVFDPDAFHLMAINVAATSYKRGYTGIAYMRILDRSGDATDRRNGVTVTIRVTIINSAPTVLADVDNEFTVVGSNSETIDPFVINIKDYVTDPNETDRPDQVGKTDTFIRIVGFSVLEPEEVSSTAVNNSSLNVLGVEMDEDSDGQICLVKPQTGYFGTQSVRIVVADGSFSDPDAFSVYFTIKITVVYNFNEIGTLKTVETLRGMTNKITIESLIDEIENTFGKYEDEDQDPIESGENGNDDGGDDDAGSDDVTTQEMPAQTARRLNDAPAVQASSGVDGMFNPGADYVIVRIYATGTDGDYVQISQDELGVWQFRAMRITDGITLSAEFKLKSAADDESVTPYISRFAVKVKENPKPELIPAFVNGYTFYSVNTGDKDFLLNQDGKINLVPADMFTDNVGDIMSFVSAESRAPSLVEVRVIDGDNLEISFKASGSTDITVWVSDSTGESVSYTFRVTNYDLPNPTFWMTVMISFETNTVMWIAILAGVVLFIFFIIILIIALKRRKRKREELEAMLVSEMELEEQLMRLSAGLDSQGYQSYGYLPPAMNMQNDPGLMLGGGAAAPDNNAIGLNPGQVNYGAGSAPGGGNNGVPHDSDM